MGGRVSVEDRADVQDLLARYCWAVDEGDADGYAGLFTEDGVFAGVSPQPLRGRQMLRNIPGSSLKQGVRHSLTNLVLDYGDSADELIAKGYNTVTSWLAAPAFYCNALAQFRLVRQADGWKIKSLQVRMMVPPDSARALPEGFPIPADQPTAWPPI